MDNLVKALKCSQYYECDCTLGCDGCAYKQDEYTTAEACVLAADKIIELQKSNRNWRRKCQRLRKELKEVKKNGIS